jgi:serine/threonine-protein kinase
MTASNLPIAEQRGVDTPRTGVYAPSATPAAPNRWILYAAVAALAIASVAIVYFAFFSRSAPEQPQTPEQPVAQTPKVDKANPPSGMVYVPGGTYMMGRNTEDPYEGPPHEVKVAPFFMDKTEVTNRQYAEFIQATGYKPPPDWEGGSYQVGTADFPVVKVDWNDARAYAEWAKKRLPTEAEWEFAARGTTNRVYPWGDDWIPNAAYTKESRLSSLQPVGSAPSGASPFGLLDMSGSVWEWCSDNFAPYPGSTAPAKDPTYKIIRGGSLGDVREKATTTYRNWVPPEDRYDGLGFRCARSAE